MPSLSYSGRGDVSNSGLVCRRKHLIVDVDDTRLSLLLFERLGRGRNEIGDPGIVYTSVWHSHRNSASLP